MNLYGQQLLENKSPSAVRLACAIAMTLRAGRALSFDTRLQVRVCNPKFFYQHYKGGLCGCTHCMVSAILELNVSIIADSTNLRQSLQVTMAGLSRPAGLHHKVQQSMQHRMQHSMQAVQCLMSCAVMLSADAHD